MGRIHHRKCSIRPEIRDSSPGQKPDSEVEEGSECMFFEDLKLYIRHHSKHHTQPPRSLKTHRSLRGGTLYCSSVPQGPECCCAHRRHLVFSWQLISFKCFNGNEMLVAFLCRHTDSKIKINNAIKNKLNYLPETNFCRSCQSWIYTQDFLACSPGLRFQSHTSPSKYMR